MKNWIFIIVTILIVSPVVTANQSSKNVSKKLPSDYKLAEQVKNYDNDVSKELLPDYKLAEQARNNNNFGESFRIYTNLSKSQPDSFSISYGYGRLLAQMKLYADSEKVLNQAISSKKIFDPSIYNTFGWVLLMNNKYEFALEQFQKALDKSIYDGLEQDIRMKLHNNAGITYMLLDRYEEAKKQFILAEQLGSIKAKENIEKVESLILVKKQADSNIPGVFSVVVGSTKSKDKLDEVRVTKAAKIGISKTDLAVFISETGKYFIVFGSGYNYQKALDIKDNMIKKGINDAFVSSTTNWQSYKK